MKIENIIEVDCYKRAVRMKEKRGNISKNLTPENKK